MEIRDGAVTIAAITSCTNTSNPYVLMAAGLLARNAAKYGLKSKPWVKTSLAPGSRVVTDYLTKAGLLEPLASIGFNVVGYGCTTCIGNSGPLKPEISAGIKAGDIVATSVLSGNRNFEGRVHPEIKMNFLASPPLVVAYALAGTMNVDLQTEVLGTGLDGKPVLLANIWPSDKEVADAVHATLDSGMFRKSYGNVFAGEANWQAIKIPLGKIYDWQEESTYVRNPPYFDGMTMTPRRSPTSPARAVSRCWVTRSPPTTSRRPATSPRPAPPRSTWCPRACSPSTSTPTAHAVGNHEVMMRGTFANIRLRNLLAPGTEGGVTIHVPTANSCPSSTPPCATSRTGTPLVILAGKEYGTGSSRDWAAKGTMLLGVRAVIAETFERIHRSNLIGMGVLPLMFPVGKTAALLGLTGQEVFEITGLDNGRGEVRESGCDAGQGLTHQLRSPRAHRHSQGARLLPPRWHPAVRAAPACEQARVG
jgi:aconitate hydratase